MQETVKNVIIFTFKVRFLENNIIFINNKYSISNYELPTDTHKATTAGNV